MPIIKEEALTSLNKQIESQKNQITNLKDDLDEVSDNNYELKNHRLILAIISGVLAFLMLIGFITYFFYPNSFLNLNSLEENGLKIMSVEEYQELEEKLNSNTTEDNIIEENAFSNDENQDNLDTDSINDTIIYTVQIAAFEKNNIQLFSDNLVQFKEVFNDDFYKYSIGAFSTLEEAQLFRKELVKLGFNDAFIASYKNGDRLKIEEVY